MEKAESGKAMAQLGNTNITKEADNKTTFNNPVFNIQSNGDGRSLFDDIQQLATSKGYAV